MLVPAQRRKIVNDHPWPVRTDKARFALVDYQPYGYPDVTFRSDAPFSPIGTCPIHGVQPVTGFHTTPGFDPTTFPTLACGGMDPEQF